MNGDYKGCTDFKRENGVAYICCHGCHFEELHAGVTVVFRMTDYHLCCGAIPPLHRPRGQE